MDPAAVQRRKGGRPPTEDDMLRGFAFCGACGRAMFTRRRAVGRVYVRSGRREARGTCRAEPIPAEIVERHVLGHLDVFVGDVAEWLSQQVAEREASSRRDSPPCRPSGRRWSTSTGSWRRHKRRTTAR
jgi:hypothetical protein